MLIADILNGIEAESRPLRRKAEKSEADIKAIADVDTLSSVCLKLLKGGFVDTDELAPLSPPKAEPEPKVIPKTPKKKTPKA